MDAKAENNLTVPWLERLRKWSGPAAVLGAFSAFAAAVFRARPEPAAASKLPGAALPVLPTTPSAAPVGDLPRSYTPAGIIAAPDSAHPFRRSLACVAVGDADRIYALGDSVIRIFDSAGTLAEEFRAPDWAACIAAAAGDRIIVAGGARIEILDASGRPAGGFAVQGRAGGAAFVTAVKVSGESILAADAAARLIYRYDFAGRRLGEIGTRIKTGSFMLPNRLLDFDVDTKGRVVAGDSGRHRVTIWSIDGVPQGSFGKFGMADPSHFVGCCNPVDIAWAPDGNIVTAEKMIARVKVYESEGKLLAVIGPEYFDPQCTSIRLAVDSRGRILAADPVRRQIRIFQPEPKGGTR